MRNLYVIPESQTDIIRKHFIKAVNVPEGDLWMLKWHTKREQGSKFTLTFYSPLHCPPLIIKTGGLMLDSNTQRLNKKNPNVKLFRIFECDT